MPNKIPTCGNSEYYSDILIQIFNFEKIPSIFEMDFETTVSALFDEP